VRYKRKHARKKKRKEEEERFKRKQTKLGPNRRECKRDQQY
jgi:hypothetical protein